MSPEVSGSFNGGLKFGLGFSLAMIPLLAVFFAGAYFLSQPTTQNAAVPIERVTTDLITQVDKSLNQMIDRLRQIIEAMVTRFFDRADEVTETATQRAIERLREVSNDTVARIDERTGAVLQSTAGLMEQQFTRFTDSSVQSWRHNTDAIIARIVELLEQQARQMADIMGQALRAAFGSLIQQ